MHARHESPIEPGGRTHAVVFFSDEHALARTAADFLQPDPARVLPAIVIATPPRRSLIAGELARRGLHVERLVADGALHVIDSNELLERVMSGPDPNPARFHATVHALIDRACGGRPGAVVRAYGDAVDLLWKRGNPEAAIRLELLWNRLATPAQLSLLCAYALGSFSHRSASRPDRQAVCDHHDRVFMIDRGR